MNSTRNRPGAHVFENGYQRLVVRIEEVQAALRPGAANTPREALQRSIASLERLIPALSQYLASQSLLSQDWDTNGRQRMEEQLNQSRSKLRELQVLLDSGRRLLLEESESDTAGAIFEAINVYLVPSLEDMKDALLAQAEVRTQGKS